MRHLDGVCHASAAANGGAVAGKASATAKSGASFFPSPRSKKWNPGALDGRLVQQMIELKLTWSEAVAILGLAAKTIAQAAASAGGGDANRFVEKGCRQLLGAFDCEVRVTVKDRAPA
ncbi:MAG: hypothetical protein V4793_05975 [Paraburkholderia tropica]|uniref:hypothetical protein n=1 Tax=Paraburkholderia tropica TaxID=92647 RepID=UPI0031012CB5